MSVGKRAQLIAMKRPLRPLRSCSTCAAHVLPEPERPCRNTGSFDVAADASLASNTSPSVERVLALTSLCGSTVSGSSQVRPLAR